MLDCMEAFYGGAGGGGKSDALLMGALQYVDVPGYVAIIFRRTFSELALSGALMDRAHEWLDNSDAHWDEESHKWTFPTRNPDGTKGKDAVLQFGYLENENDKFRYRGIEAQFIGFDELTTFTRTQFTFLFSRLRRLQGSMVPIRMRSASNPGGIGHEWVKERYIEPGRRDRIFIPATLDDNPFIDRDEYRASLAHLDSLDRAQIERGDWTARAVGRKFRREWFRVIDKAAMPRVKWWVRNWDLAATDPKPGTDPDNTSGTLMGYTYDGEFVIADCRVTKDTPKHVEVLVKNTASQDGKAVPITMEQEPGASGKSLIDYYGRTHLLGYDFRGIRATGSKEVRANPLSAAAEAGRVMVIRADWNEDLFDELETFPQKGFHDDRVDSTSGAFTQLIEIYEIDLGSTMRITTDTPDPDERSRRPRNLKEYREQNSQQQGSLAQVRRV